MKKIIILPNNNSLNFLDDIKDKKNIISYNKLIEKINNNDILKYPANTSVLNFYIVIDLLTKLIEHDTIYIIPNSINYQLIYKNIINILKTQRNFNSFEIFCIEDINADRDYFIYNTNILDESKWVLEYNNKIVHSEDDFETIKQHISKHSFFEIGNYHYNENNISIESKLFSFQ